MTRPLFPVLFSLFAITLAAAAQEPQVYNNVPSARLEKILGDLKIQYKKEPGKKEGVQYYDFKRDDLSLRLHNYGGQDLWLECVFAEKMSLDDVNRWNARAKYSRAVLLKQDDRASISLESQLDCLGGVTDPIVRQFITRFDGEVAAFTKFIKKK